MTIPVTKQAGKTFLGIQVLRVFAALLVVLVHAIGAWNERILKIPEAVRWLNAHAGVDVFFVISGFVMAITVPGLNKYPNKAGVFLWRRIVRIAPLYWMFTTFQIARFALGFKAGSQEVGSVWHVIACYLFIPSLGAQNIIAPLVGVGWTLEFEMLFYYLFAIALALEIAPLVFLAPALGALAIAGWFYQPSWPAFTVLASPLVLEFLFGVILGELTLRGRLPGRTAGIFLLIGGCAVLLSIPLGSFYAARTICWGLPACAVVAGTLILEDDLGRRFPRWLLELGNASYATYLAHGFVIPLVWVGWLRFGGSRGAGGFVGMMACSVGFSLAAGELIHRFIELPLMTVLRGKSIPGVSTLPAQTPMNS